MIFKTTRIAISFLIILTPILGLAQYPSIDTLNYGHSVDHVVNYFHYDSEAEKVISKSFFNKKGLLVLTYYGYDDIIQDRSILEYDKNGDLKLTKGERYISPKNDSVSEAYSKERWQLMEKNIDYKSEEWNRLNAKYESLYEVVNPEQISWTPDSKLQPGKIIIRNIAGQDSVVEHYNSFLNKESYLDERIFFYYNELGQLKRKIWIDVPQENVFEFQAFKPNSIEIEDSIKVLTNSYREKVFTYFQDSIKVDYSVNGEFTGHEIRRTKKSGLIKEEIVLSAENDTLSYFLEHYNSDNLRTMRKRVIHKGYNGFGYSLDLAWGDIKIYKYDSKDRLVRIDGYDGDTHIFTQRFEIIEK